MGDSYEALGTGPLTPEQLDGMEMWDRDVMLAEPHRAVGAMLVRRACAEIRELRLCADRAVTIADEAFGLGPVETLDATLSRIERGIHEQAKELRAMRERHGAEDKDRVRQVVRDAIGEVAETRWWREGSRPYAEPEAVEAVANHCAEQLSAPSVRLSAEDRQILHDLRSGEERTKDLIGHLPGVTPAADAIIALLDRLLAGAKP